MKRKLISLLLTVCLFVTFLPSTALADIYMGEVGSAGENIIYEFGATTGLFYAHGTGDMWNFDITGHPAPWSDIKHLIKSVNIGQGINAIGSCTFNNCSNLQSVLIDSGVTEIGSGAFDNCSMLTNIELPNSILKINSSTFRNCTGLTNIRLPESVTELGSMTFLGCTRLRSVNIPTSIKRIANNLFYECSSLSTIEIPVGVTDIGIAAFKGCASLGTVTIPEGVTKMQWNAFYDCTGLKTVYLPVSLTTIEYDAFSNCYNLSDVYYAGSESQWNSISTNGTIFGGSNPTIHFAIEDPIPQQYTVSFDPNGGIVGTVSKTVTNGGTYGDLPTPTRSNYTFDGWFTSISGGTQVTSDTTVNLTSNQTLYAHWTSTVNPYNLGDETYSFINYGDSDSFGGHCFGMSITSAGYYNDLLDISGIGGNSNTPLYSFSRTQTVTQPICLYQGIQGTHSTRATVAGGSYYLKSVSNISSDWQQVVNYVRNHNYDNTGILQIGFRKNNEGGHAINFLRYENVNGQDRIYAYDNNYPNQETYFYRDSSGRVLQAPMQTFSGAIDCIALRDCRTYFNSVAGFDSTHVLYMAKDAASVQGYTYSYMDGTFADEEYVMYEIPVDQDRVIIIPNRDNATFTYMDKEYSFGAVTDETRGELKLATIDEGTADTNASFQIFEDSSVTPTPKPWENPFSDVSNTAWYIKAVEYVATEGLMGGYPNGQFGPNDNISRAEFAQIIYNKAGRPDAGTSVFTDVQAGQWYANAIIWAAEQKVVSGIGNGQFAPNRDISREELATMLWRYAGSPKPGNATLNFTDAGKVSTFAKEAMLWANENKIVNGKGNGILDPKGKATRAETAQMLMNYLKK